ncbi:MAG TPA: hypothetical protein VF624_05955, partial [Tepidisphaeraceae bacterium]
MASRNKKPAKTMAAAPTKGKRPLMVGIVTDGSTSYGRSILRGIMRFANLERRWLLHKDIWRTPESLARFPQCDGAIISGLPAEASGGIVQRSRIAV